MPFTPPTKPAIPTDLMDYVITLGNKLAADRDRQLFEMMMKENGLNLKELIPEIQDRWKQLVEEILIEKE